MKLVSAAEAAKKPSKITRAASRLAGQPLPADPAKLTLDLRS